MSFLPDAHDFVVGELINHQTNYNVSSDHSGIDILLNASTPEAAVDAGERDYAPSCFPDTRIQYIEDITNWATASNGNHLPIYWMRGPAGVGKSAIAQTCAQKVQESGHLGAAFFFSINGRQKDHTRFFSTLAYQLSTILDDYRKNVNLRILKDKTLVTKTMKVQFQSLIVEPLRELKEQGKEVRMRPIFIDGLDECGSEDAQVEIIKIIASSVLAKSTPFRWAIFSRDEWRIASTFKLPDISPHCRVVYLPISRDSDKEIETYLRGEFENILRRRSIVLSSPWPADEDIQKLVDAAAGLFAYCATVLRFIDTHSLSGFKKTLQDVLEVIAQPRSHPTLLFADLDRLYTLILQRVPENILSSMLLFLRMSLSAKTYTSNNEDFDVAFYCNVLGISETIFQDVCYHLQAVMTYRRPAQPFQVLDPRIDLMRPCWDQLSLLGPSSPLTRVREAHGAVSILHRSFKDFLLDPNRSSVFCCSARVLFEAYVDRLVQQHLHYASSYVVQGSKLALAPSVTSSSSSLSWPQGTEFVDSYLKFYVFSVITCILTFHLPEISAFSVTLSPHIVQRLPGLDRRISYIIEAVISESLRSNTDVMHWLRHIRQIEGTNFRCIQSEGYNKFNPAHFKARVKELEKCEILKAFHPRVPSTLASVYNFYSQTKIGKQYGLYQLGSGEKSVIWYWEVDAKRRYYRDFWTVDYAEAKRVYKTEKFKMWEESWVPPS